jgi:hypothetical protein
LDVSPTVVPKLPTCSIVVPAWSAAICAAFAAAQFEPQAGQATGFVVVTQKIYATVAPALFGVTPALIICMAGLYVPPVAEPAHVDLNVKLVEFAETAVPLMLYAATEEPAISKPWLATRAFATVTVATLDVHVMVLMVAAERLSAANKDKTIIFIVCVL